MNMLRFLIDTSHYETPLERYRAWIVYATVGLLMVFYTVYAVTIPDWTRPGSESTVTMMQFIVENPSSGAAVAFVGVYVIGLAAYAANRLGRASVAAWTLLATWFVGNVLLTLSGGPFPAVAGTDIMVLLIMAALLTGQRGVGISWGVSIAALLLRVVSSDDLSDQAVASLFSAMLLASSGTVLLLLYLRFIQLSRQEGATRAVEERTLAAQVLTRIAQQVAKRARLDTLLSEIVSEINNQFDMIYHTQVFLLDDGGQKAKLVASTGDVGQKLLTRGHELAVGSASVIGQVTLQGAPTIARSGASDTVHRRNELLPDTMVEGAFPLRIGDRIIGALDVQSKDIRAFEDEHLISAFQALADSITLAIDNVRQYENAQARLQENERLVEEARQALREVERLNDRLTRQAWSDYLKDSGGALGLTVNFETDAILPHADLTPTLREAVEIRHLVQGQVDNRQVIAVPIRVRGRVIGAMEFELDDNKAFTPEDFDLVQEVSERFGLAVENARLVDESQRVAHREALVNQISSRLQTANDVETMLTEAARSLQSALSAQKIAIRLGTPPEVQPNGNGREGKN